MIHLSRYQDAPPPSGPDLAIITDPPYSARTHDGQHETVGELAYSAWTPDDVRAAVATWATWNPAWICAITDDVLTPAWREAYRAAGLLDFAPIPCVHPDSVRLTGDGPASGCVWLVVARRGSLPGHYIATRSRDGYRGGKPLGLMREIVRDYSRPGWTVADPCCGWGTTLVAAAGTRQIWGAEVSPAAHKVAVRRVGEVLAQGVLL